MQVRSPTSTLPSPTVRLARDDIDAIKQLPECWTVGIDILKLFLVITT